MDRQQSPDHTSKKRTHALYNVDRDHRQLCPQQRFVKRPKHPGMATFDSELRQLPLQRNRAKQHDLLLDFERRVAVHNTSNTREPQAADTNEIQSPRSDADETISQGSSHSEDEHASIRSCLRATGSATDALTIILSDEYLCTSIEMFRSLPRSTISFKPNHTQNCSLSHERTPSFPLDHHFAGKLIYIDILDTNNSTNYHQAPFSDSSRSASLCRLREALLQTHHDFLLVSKDFQTPPGLKRLATNYGTSTFRRGLEQEVFVHHMRQMSVAHHAQMNLVLEEARAFLNMFERKLCLTVQEWACLNKTLHQYLHCLMHFGLNVRCVYKPCDQNHFVRPAPIETSQGSLVTNIEAGISEMYARKHPPQPIPTFQDIEQRYAALGIDVKDCVFSLISGWLCFGPRIAKTFHDFCRGLKFLAWFGATF